MASKSKGTFAACWLEPSSAAMLHQHFLGPPGLKEPERFHLTTTYTDVVLPSLLSCGVSFRIDRRTFAYDMFGDDNSLLVMKVKSPNLDAFHRHALEQGATWDYPDFNAHLTLTDCFDGDPGKLPPLPSFDLHVDRYIVEPLPRVKGFVPVLPAATGL